MIKNLYRLLLIREGEQGNVLYFLVFFLLVSMGMAIGRGTVDALFLKRLGIEYLPLMYVIQSVVLAVVSLVYAGFADRVPAERFFRVLFIGLLLLIAMSWSAMGLTSNPLVYPAYYLVYEVASELMLVHAALYMNQNMNTLQAKRLAPLAFAGVQVGTIIGGLVLVVGTPMFGTRNLLLAWCVLLLASILVLVIRHHRVGPSTHFRAPARSGSMLHDCLDQVSEGVKYTVKSDLLRSSSFALYFMVIAFYILCYSVNRVYTHTFDSEESLTRFFGILSATTGSIALFLQVFVTGRAIRYFGIRTMNLVFPVTTIASLAALSLSFTLPVALAGSINKDSVMTAFRNPVRSIFLNVLPDYIQGRARAMAVAIVLPLALMTCGLMLLSLQALEQPVLFLAPGILAAFLYLYSDRKMNKAYVATLLATLKERLHLPDRKMYGNLAGSGEDVLQEIHRGVKHEDTEVCIAYSRLLTGSFPETAPGVIIERLQQADNAMADRLVLLLAGLDVSQHAAALNDMARRGDPHLQATITNLLLKKGDPEAVSRSLGYLQSENPRLRALAVCASLRFPEAGQAREQAVTAWMAMLEGPVNTRLASLDLIPDMGMLSESELQKIRAAYTPCLEQLLENSDDRIRMRALRGIQAWEGMLPPGLQALVSVQFTSGLPEVREAATACLKLVDDTIREPLALKAAGDCNIRVRETAIKVLDPEPGYFEEFAVRVLTENTGTLRAQQVLLETLNEHGLPAATSRIIAESKSGEARRLEDALLRLRTETGMADTAASRLLVFALQEQLEQNIELALQALEPLYEPDIMRVISTGFMSGDPRHIANAIEALETLGDDTILGELHGILLRSSEKEETHDTNQFKTADAVIAWCNNHSSDWIRQITEQIDTSAQAKTT